MLNRIRTKHTKKVLWFLSIIIIISFTFWGSASFFQKNNKQILGTIGKKKITPSDFSYYYRMGQLWFVFISMNNPEQKISEQGISVQAWQYILLLWKIDKEKIEVQDNEVYNYIKAMFTSRQGVFDKEYYHRFLKNYLRMPAANFEEYIRNFIKIDKLFERYVKIEVTEEDAVDLYKKTTQEAQIAYLRIPYEKFQQEQPTEQEDVTIPAQETKNPAEQSHRELTKEFCEKLLAEIKEENITDLKKLSKYKEAEYKTTGSFKFYDEIEGIGRNEEISQAVFSLSKQDIYTQPIMLNGAAVIVQLLDITDFSDEDFQKKKQEYLDRLTNQKTIIERIKFISILEKESELKIFSENTPS